MLIGLTGGMGCGKSSALDFFSELGLNALSADIICHELYSDRDSLISKAMHEKWGDVILNDEGTIDRRAVAELVFNDPGEREWLNSIIHPEVLRKGQQVYKSSNNMMTVFDVPLLFEVGWEEYFDIVITIWTEPGLRYERLKARGMKDDEIKLRDKSQLSPESKMEKADYVIINNGSFEQLKEQCIKIINKLNKETK